MPNHFHLLVRTGSPGPAHRRDQEITETEFSSGSRMRKVSEARRVFCRSSVGELGYPAATVARFLGVATSAVVRAARAEELQDQLWVQLFRNNLIFSVIIWIPRGISRDGIEARKGRPNRPPADLPKSQRDGASRLKME